MVGFIEPILGIGPTLARVASFSAGAFSNQLSAKVLPIAPLNAVVRYT
jgi:hypothetical protein